jgi:Flp pilus assembly protein TadG
MKAGKPRSREAGQQLVEFALILPLLLLLLFGLIEFGLIVYAYNTLANAGREVARYGSITPQDSEIRQFITDTMMTDDRRWAIGIRPEDLNVETALADNGPLVSTVHVTVSYTYTYMTGPLLSLFSGDPDVKLQTTSTMYTERRPIIE